MSQQAYEQTVAVCEQALSVWEELVYFDFIDGEKTYASGTVVFDESEPGFFIHDMKITDKDGNGVRVSDKAYRRLCAGLIEVYLFEEEES